MKNLLNILLIVLTGITSTNTYAQAQGQQIPYINIETWNDGKKEPLTTGDLKGKLIILDFWNIWCASCISAMPKMDSLQEEFGDRIKILLVTKNSKDQADNLFSRIGTKSKKASFVYGDSVFNAMFPHQGEPFHVWIDTTGKAIFQTAGYNTNKKNINAYLSRTKGFTLPHEAGISKFDLNNSIAELIGSSDYKGIRGYSIFSKNINEISDINLGRVFEKDSLSGKIRKIKLFNLPILELIRYALILSSITTMINITANSPLSCGKSCSLTPDIFRISMKERWINWYGSSSTRSL